MAKASGKRHSKTEMQPVTINLEAEETKPEADFAESRAESDAPVDGGHAGPDDAQEGIASSIEEETAPDAEAAPSSEDGIARAAVEEPGEERPAAPETRRRGGSALIPAIIGGLIALAGAAGLQWAGVIPQRQPDLSGLQQLPGAIGAIEDRLGKLEVSAADTSNAGGGSDIADRLSAAESAIKALQTNMASAGGTGTEQIAQLSTQLDDVQSRIDEIASAQAALSKTDTGAFADTLSEIEKKLDATTSAAASARDDLAGQIATLKSEVDQLSQVVHQQESQPKVAGAIAAAALKSAIDRGVPFTAELDTYAAVAGDGEEVAALRNFAAKGVPTQADLNKEIAGKADAMIAAARAPSGEEGVVARLMAGARSLVSVRPVGEVKGDTPEAIVARLEADINAGRLDAALNEYGALPEASKKTAGSLSEDINARLTADSIVAKTISGALVPAGSSSKQEQ